MALIGSEPPKEFGKGFAKSMLKPLNALRAWVIESRITNVNVRSTRDASERLGWFAKPSKSGTIVDLIVGGGGAAEPFTFRMEPAGGDTTGAFMLIHYGECFGPGDAIAHTPHVPDGMDPVADDYVLDGIDTDGDIWLAIPVASGTSNINDGTTPITIDSGAEMPDNTDVLKYVRIGTVVVQTAETGPPIITVKSFSNTQCGDVFLTGSPERYSFEMFDASDSEGLKVLIIDGEINGELPDGMGSDDYILSVSDGDEVYAIVTYDTDTFAITSRTLANASSIPDDELGTVNVGIGYVNATGDGLSVIPHNRQCGDINLYFHYVTISGALSLQAFAVYGQPVAIPEV